MRNRTSIVILCSITVSALLSGCGASNKIPDATIKTAIQDSTNIYSDYNLAIQELSFLSRNYDKKEKSGNFLIRMTDPDKIFLLFFFCSFFSSFFPTTTRPKRIS